MSCRRQHCAAGLVWSAFLIARVSFCGLPSFFCGGGQRLAVERQADRISRIRGRSSSAAGGRRRCWLVSGINSAVEPPTADILVRTCAAASGAPRRERRLQEPNVQQLVVSPRWCRPLLSWLASPTTSRRGGCLSTNVEPDSPRSCVAKCRIETCMRRGCKKVGALGRAQVMSGGRSADDAARRLLTYHLLMTLQRPPRCEPSHRPGSPPKFEQPDARRGACRSRRAFCSQPCEWWPDSEERRAFWAHPSGSRSRRPSKLRVRRVDLKMSMRPCRRRRSDGKTHTTVPHAQWRPRLARGLLLPT